MNIRTKRWEFIKENQKVRKKENKLLTWKRKWSRKNESFFLSWSLSWSRSCFLPFFLDLFLSLSWSRACVLSFFTSSWGWLNGRVVLRANLTATQDAQPNKTSIVASIIEEDVSMTSSLGGSSAAPSTESAVFAEDRSDKSQYIANHVIKVSGQGQGQSQV